ncbi:superoxide dismutase family protein [Altererythrobacter sp. MF3-039]|uniref:superoxide dismutase family protein n=1 Tax=Altererythrobacter sp. MF3-039 TaxID=3252901 RepID=UPI00390CAE69
MPRSITFAAIASLTALVGCTSEPQEVSEGEPLIQPLATAELADAEGKVLGSAVLSGDGSGLMVAVEVEGIAQGPHGFHLHTAGDCSATDFTSAGGHLNPLGKSHGSENPDGKHLGDLPNLDIGPDGSGNATVELQGELEDLLGYLFDDDGTAVVIHEGPDDYVSDPAGAAGSRIACGALTRS